MVGDAQGGGRTTAPRGTDFGLARLAVRRLEVLASARWPEPDDAPPPRLPGFVLSSFSPLVAEVCERCLRQAFGSPAAKPGGLRVGIVLASRDGDVATLAAVAQAVETGRAVAPLLFFQSVPNAVCGYVAARWGLAGPVVCTSPTGDAAGDAVGVAELLLGDGDADAMLAVAAEQGRGPDGTPDPAADRAEAALAVLRGGDERQEG